MSHNCTTKDIVSKDTVDETLVNPSDKATRVLNKYAFKLEEQLRYPAIVGVELVEDCNLSCGHCFLNSRSEPTTYHTMEQLRDLYRQITEAKALKVYLTGGETMLHPSFSATLELFADGPFDLSVFTNGTLVDEKIIERIEHLNDDVVFQVSLDGLGDIHENMRGIPADSVLNGIELLVDGGFDVHVRSTIQPENVEAIESIYEECINLNVDYIDFAPLLPTVNWETFSKEPYADFQQTAISNYAEFIKSREEFPVSIFQNPVSVPFGWDIPDAEEPDGYICPAATSALEVDATGEVYPCPYLHYEEFSAGNVYETDMLTIWDTVDSQEWETMIDYWCVDHQACTDCPQAEMCKGACHAAGYHWFGDLESPDFRCPKVLQGENNV